MTQSKGPLDNHSDWQHRQPAEDANPSLSPTGWAPHTDPQGTYGVNNEVQSSDYGNSQHLSGAAGSEQQANYSGDYPQHQGHPQSHQHTSEQLSGYDNGQYAYPQQPSDMGYPQEQGHNHAHAYEHGSNYDNGPVHANAYADPHNQMQFGPASNEHQHQHQHGQMDLSPNAGVYNANNDQQHPYSDEHAGYDLTNYKPAAQPNEHTFGQTAYASQNWEQESHPTHDPYTTAHGHPNFSSADGRASGQITTHHHGEDAEHDDYEEYEEESGGTRKIIIAAALVSTIIVGGAFAYGYNTLFSKPSTESAMPVVSASKISAKVQPADPGGRKFENTDSQLMNRIGNRGQADAFGDDSANGNRVRTVSTLVVGRDGRLIEQQSKTQTAPPRQQQQALANSSSGIPGMIIEGGTTSPESASPSVAAISSQPVVSVPPVTTPQVQLSEPEKVISSNPPPQSEPQPQVSRRNSKFPPLPVRSGLVKPGVDLGRETPVPNSYIADANNVEQASVRQTDPNADASNGYVAVLSTKRSRIDALTSFADLQQRYPSILGTKVPDVRKADLSSRGLGIMYRAIVGPPGSRDVASQLCSRLKTVGYENCWIAPY